MAKKLQTKSSDDRSAKGSEIKIKDFSILLDAMEVLGKNQENTNKSLNKMSSSSKKTEKKTDGYLKKLMKSTNVKSSIEKLNKSNDKIVKLQSENNKLQEKILEKISEANEQNDFQAVADAETAKEKAKEDQKAKELDAKDRATIISKLSALEEKDLTVQVNADGGSMFGGLLSSLLPLIAGLAELTAAIVALKKLLDGSLFTGPLGSTTAAIGGAAGNLGTAMKVMKKTESAKEKFTEGGKKLKEAVTGEKETEAAPKEKVKEGVRVEEATTPKEAVKVEAVASEQAVPKEKLSFTERVGSGGRGAVEVARGAAELGGAASSSTLRTAGAMGVASVAGAALEGSLANAADPNNPDIFNMTDPKTGQITLDPTKWHGKAMPYAEGAIKAGATTAAFGLASSVGASVAGATGVRALGYAVPIAGWAWFIYDAVMSLAKSGDLSRQLAESGYLIELDRNSKAGLQNAKELQDRADKFKATDPEKYAEMTDRANALAKVSLKPLAQFSATVSANSKLDKIVDMEKWFQLWGDGNYTLNDAENVIKGLDKVEGKTTEEKIINALNYAKDPYSSKQVVGLKRMVDTIGMGNTIALVDKGSPVISEYEKNITMDPMEYFSKQQKELEEAAKKQKEQEQKRAEWKARPGWHTGEAKFEDGASLVHSSSPYGMPAMVGEKGNPETIIPLKKFDEVISSYLTTKNVSLNLDAKDYDQVTTKIRDSYLEEKMLNSSSQPVVINNINNNSMGSAAGGGEGANMQYQTSLARTFDTVFEMLLQKNFKTAME